MRNNPFGTGVLIFFAVLFLLTLPVPAYSNEAVQHYQDGNTFVRSGNYSLAVAAYDQAISLEPKYFEAFDGKADALNRAGEYTESLAASARSLEANPGYVKGWINRGQILYNIGYYYEDTLNETKKADEYYREQLLAFEKAIELDPDNADAWFNKGYALAGMKRYDEAIAAFNKVQALDPAYPNLALNQKQARVLREAATPAYMNYLLPFAALLILIAIACIFLYKRMVKPEKEEPEAQNRQARRKKER